MLSDRCPVRLSVCNVRALWPNSCTDQDETWHAGRPWLWPHCVRWGPSSPSPNRAHPQFLAHICCGQMAAWIRTPLGMKLGLGPGDFVLDGEWGPRSRLPKKAAEPLPPEIFGPCLLGPNGWMDQDGIWHGGRSQSWRHCVRWGPSSLPKKGAETPQFSAHLYCGQMAGWIKMARR